MPLWAKMIKTRADTVHLRVPFLSACNGVIAGAHCNDRQSTYTTRGHPGWCPRQTGLPNNTAAGGFKPQILLSLTRCPAPAREADKFKLMGMDF
jgi:hypothetical protein